MANINHEGKNETIICISVVSTFKLSTVFLDFMLFLPT